MQQRQQQRSNIIVTCRVVLPASSQGPGNSAVAATGIAGDAAPSVPLTMHVPLHIAARICERATRQGRIRTLSDAAAVFIVLPAITQLRHLSRCWLALPRQMIGLRTLHLQRVTFMQLPADLRALESITLRCSGSLWNWLPATSAANVHTLVMAEMEEVSVPAGMRALTQLTVIKCTKPEKREWLPACSAVAVRTLSLDRSSLVQVPEGMRALEDISVRFCSELSDGWLPESSAARVVTLDVRGTLLT
jgi:hypothetical protein